MSQHQLAPSGSFIPNSLYQDFRRAIMMHRQRALWLSKQDTNPDSSNRHTACWNDVLEMSDPDCSVCGGSGFLLDTNRRYVKCVIYFDEPHGFQGGAGSLHTVGGKVDRVDAWMYVMGDEGQNIREDDIIIFPPDDVGRRRFEFTVITKVPYFVFGEKPFLYRIMLFKSIRPEYLTTGTEST